ncbi:prepilin-type N-terminal cleavage/methylation domain-containing protein, partial [Candidatus Saccharibacteria bacterium]|nr:prepilin-type N-terminal cleavage/methylation domain-containing protein [Candidatus Saccharibacteria bacterium]
MKKYNQSGFGIVELLLVVVVVGLVGALGWLVYSRVSKNSNGNSTESTNTEEATGDVVSAPNVNITEW